MGKASRVKAERRGLVPTGAVFHGGRAGLLVDTILLPGMLVPAERDTLTAGLSPKALHSYGPNKVWVTVDYDLALAYASRAGAVARDRADGPAIGAVYRVASSLGFEPDPDYPPGVSFGTKRAEILEVVEAAVPGSWDPPTPAGLRFMTWDDSTRMYDDEGYPLPPKAARQLGITAADLRYLGYAAEHTKINNACSDRLKELYGPNISQADVDRIRRELNVSTSVDWHETKKR